MNAPSPSPARPEPQPSITPSTPTREHDVQQIQDRYAKRLKARLAQPKIDMVSARDGILDCFVATYFGGLKHGISGTLGIDAREEQVAHIAQALFRKKLRARGVSFESPSIDALEAVKEEVDAEWHFHELPAELSGIHDQVCSLMLSKAEGSLEHSGASSSVTASAGEASPPRPTPATSSQSALPGSPETDNAPIDGTRAPTLSLRRAPTPSAPTPTPTTREGLASTAPRERAPRSSTSLNLRAALADYLEDTAKAVRDGESVSALHARLAKVRQLLDTVGAFEG